MTRHAGCSATRRYRYERRTDGTEIASGFVPSVLRLAAEDMGMVVVHKYYDPASMDMEGEQISKVLDNTTDLAFFVWHPTKYGNDSLIFTQSVYDMAFTGLAP